MFNAGYIYTDIRDIVIFFQDDSDIWYDLGFSAGDLSMRFLYSDFVYKDYYFNGWF